MVQQMQQLLLLYLQFLVILQQYLEA